MNDDALQYTIDWLKDREILKDITGCFILELMECYLDQAHDEETVKEVPTIFCEIVIELIENGYLD